MDLLSEDSSKDGKVSIQNTIIHDSKVTLVQTLQEEIEKDLPGIVDILKKEIPSLNEIRIFGSFITDRWNAEHSDIDIFIELADEEYSSDIDVKVGSDNMIIESAKRQILRKNFFPQIKSKYKNRFQFHILTPVDVRRCWNYTERNKGFLGQNMKKGKLLYQKI